MGTLRVPEGGSTGTQFSHPVTHVFGHSSSKECATGERIEKLLSEFRDSSFYYEGTGSLEGFVYKLIKKDGYSVEQLRDALLEFEQIPDWRIEKGLVRDHAAYYLSILHSQNPYGP